MNQHEEIARVWAGLRKAAAAPDSFLFVDGVVDWSWDQDAIGDIPVFHAEWMQLPNDGRGDPCPWVMLFKQERTDMGLLNSRFFKGYDEYQP